MKITPRVALEVAHHEGLVRQAYLDSVGVWTWSVGITSASGHQVERYIDNPQPLRHCLEIWLWLLERYAEDVRAAFPGGLTEAQFAAALSFHWNTGAIGRASWVRHWNAGDMTLARKRFLDWRRPPEIMGRRRAEADLLFRGSWSGDGSMTEYTRLQGSYTPDWSSARRIDVRETVERILQGAPERLGEGRERPPAPPRRRGWLAALLAWLRRVLGGSDNGGRNA